MLNEHVCGIGPIALVRSACDLVDIIEQMGHKLHIIVDRHGGVPQRLTTWRYTPYYDRNQEKYS